MLFKGDTRSLDYSSCSLNPELCDSLNAGRFPKVRGTLLGGPHTRITVCWGPSILGKHQNFY